MISMNMWILLPTLIHPTCKQMYGTGQGGLNEVNPPFIYTKKMGMHPQEVGGRKAQATNNKIPALLAGK